MFVKVADKECEMASTSLKKWFKKLGVRSHSLILSVASDNLTQKDEHAHDKKVASANIKIKQAGQLLL